MAFVPKVKTELKDLIKIGTRIRLKCDHESSNPEGTFLKNSILVNVNKCRNLFSFKDEDSKEILSISASYLSHSILEIVGHDSKSK